MRKINILLFLFFHFLFFSQKKEKITIKQQDQIYFYQIGDARDSFVIKNKSDLFLIKMSDDKKKITEIKLKNATFIKTNEENIFKLVYAPGMNYRLIYSTFANESATGFKKDKVTVPTKDKPLITEQIATDGANLDGTKEIVIQVMDTKTEKVFITNTFTYKEK